MLKMTKDQALRKAGEAAMRVDEAIRRTQDVEKALREAVEKNY